MPILKHSSNEESKSSSKKRKKLVQFRDETQVTAVESAASEQKPQTGGTTGTREPDSEPPKKKSKSDTKKSKKKLKKNRKARQEAEPTPTSSVLNDSNASDFESDNDDDICDMSGSVDSGCDSQMDDPKPKLTEDIYGR